ncbi:DUF1926 domain-containing protein [bacterium]|nr:DUF1926 domain-containing protein [bacterium]MBU1072977.1 DUF1926 domain-containing protein [bacterium]MBU1674993.1 DUF1926 domain-containing protein [bacterium]
MKLVFGVHNHQPVGNFDHVIAEIYEQSYLPFLEVAERHEHFRFCLHVSGPLLDWLQHHRLEYLERVAFLARAGRVEMLGGGFYEPILAAIPESDRIGQLRMMCDWLGQHVGAASCGVWMAERVWEPHLAGSLSRAGVKYALLDDYHFVQAGVSADDLTCGPLLTDDLGEEVALLPINEKLRYLIPFQDPEETVSACRDLHEADPHGVLVMVDDGEKFGAWPGTHELVYERGWLDRFLTGLAAERDWLELAHPSEVLAARPPRRRVYLPPSSYFEMSAWSLPMPAAERFEEAVHRYRDAGEWERMRPFFRGGFWRQFFQKYEESLLMQRRALLLHEEIARAEAVGADESRVDEARDHLWRAECNCAYWHGVFGGLYLPHLRHAIYRHLILGTKIIHSVVPQLCAQMVTLVGRMGTDVRLSNDALELFLSPDRGGALIGLEDRREDWNLQNTLRRRREAYHTRIERSATGKAGKRDDAGGSIHDLEFAVSPAVRDALGVDPQPRYSLLERFLHPGTGYPDTLDGVAAADGGDLAAAPADLGAPRFSETGALEDGRCRTLSHGYYRGPDGEATPVSVTKEVELAPSGASLEVRWTVENTGGGPLRCRFAPEWNLALYDGQVFAGAPGEDDAPVLDAVGLAPRRDFSVLVPLHNAALHWRLSDDAEIWVHPVRTATQGEDGFHLTYQGHALWFVRDLEIEPGRSSSFRITFRIEHGLSVEDG